MERNIIIEIYFNKTSKRSSQKRCLVTKSLEEVDRFLSTLVPVIQKEEIIENLIEQREDPNKFPNVILFLEIKNELLSIDNFCSSVSCLKEDII